MGGCLGIVLHGKDLKRIVEPGDFEIQIDASSRDIKLKRTLTVAE